MIDFESKAEFDEAIKEIVILITYAKKNKKSSNKYAIFNKASIVLLCAKFEAFIEEFLEDYAFKHMKNSSNKELDSFIYEHIIDIIVSDLELKKSDKSKRKICIQEIVSLCSEVEIKPVENFRIKAKFNYGKHGQDEVKRLLTAFGFKEFAEDETTKLFFNKFNGLNNIRNNIIHEDATPSLTHQDVEDYMKIMNDFVQNLTRLGIQKLEPLLKTKPILNE